MTLAILNTKEILTMTTSEIAEVVDSRLDSVKRTVDRLVEKGIISKPPMVDGIKSANGVVTQEYLIGKRDSFIVVAQLCPEFTARIVDRWQELEAKQSAPVELSRLDILTLAMESEKGRLVAIEQRDHAIATKAHIGSKREATAMATASAAKKESAKLKALMGEATENASIIAVQNKTGVQTYKWRDLKNYCEAAGLGMGKSFNPGLQLNVNTYPAGAWFDVYGVDLVELFGEVTA